MGIFRGIYFNVNEKVFFEIFKNPDKGFGFHAELDKKELTELQIDTCDFLVQCQNKKLLGTFTMVFKMDGIGEIKKLERSVEKIEFKNGKYIISNTY